MYAVAHNCGDDISWKRQYKYQTGGARRHLILITEVFTGMLSTAIQIKSKKSDSWDSSEGMWKNIFGNYLRQGQSTS